MQKYKEQLIAIFEHILPWLVLFVLLFYTYVRFFEHPYIGFKLDPNGRISYIYVPSNPLGRSLQVDDHLVQVDGLLWTNFMADLHRPLFTTYIQPGQVISLQIERNGQPEEIRWRVPGPTWTEVFQLAYNQSWLSYVFWLFGTLTLFLIRPKDQRWWLMIAFNYLTAIWIFMGGISLYHLRESAIILRMTIWLCVPVYLHFNWVVLKPLSKLPTSLVWSIYGVASVLSIAEWFQIPPHDLYYLGFLLAVAGSAVLIMLHAIFLRREARHDLRLLIVTTLLALFLPILFGLISTFGGDISVLYGGAAVFSLPFLPFGYFYALYRRQLGNLEIRVNRFISVYLFLILLGVAGFPGILMASLWPEARVFINAVTIFLTAAVSVLGFPYFQAFIERHLLGIRLPQAHLQQAYAARITTSKSLRDLQKLIEKDILPSLLVRQFVSLKFDERGAPRLFFAIGIAEEQYPHEADIPEFVAAAGKSRPFAQLVETQPYSWVRLVLPLKTGEKLIGLWLFGRRDPDDLYPQSEIPVLQSLADQTAIAQSNLLQTEHLKMFYMADIDRHELERQSLAYELHDRVLHKMANLITNPEASLPPSFQDDYDKLAEEIREIISNLRPPMLSYGLDLTIEDLANKLSERANDAISVTTEIQSDDNRYPQNVEQHVYRIVQEACENAMRHAHAKNILISGRLDSEKIILTVTDDGIGFPVVEDLNLDSLLANKHFGLANMRERAELIGAKLSMHSVPNDNTSIQVVWVEGGTREDSD